MLYGYERLKDDFKKLADSGELSHAYLLYGEPDIGKFFFAKCLANYIETGVFDAPTGMLEDVLFLDLDQTGETKEESVGIERVRELIEFLYRTPSKSTRRVAVIHDASLLTDQAQN